MMMSSCTPFHISVILLQRKHDAYSSDSSDDGPSQFTTPPSQPTPVDTGAVEGEKKKKKKKKSKEAPEEGSSNGAVHAAVGCPLC